MELTKEVFASDLIQIHRNGQMRVRGAHVYCEDGIEVSKKYYSHVLNPGQNVQDENDRVKSIAGAVWTPEVIAAFELAQAAELEKMMARTKPPEV